MKRLTTAGVAATLLAGTGAAAAPSAAQAACDAPAAARVDLAVPSFSNPTAITNPLFPRGASGHSIELGAEAGESLRFEVTQLPDIQTFSWAGQNVATRVTHFVAYRGGRILEVAVDHYAQDDAGNVWYFGEDVSNYEDGIVANKEGTWFAGRDGPPGMIMPADPKVGDVYRPENIPGLVFEEVTVQATGESVRGPRGKVPGAIFIQECLMDGTLEDKRFAPGYGEFQARVPAKDELAQVAIAVPPDVLRTPVPSDLAAISSGAIATIAAEPSGPAERVAGRVAAMDLAWDRFEEGPADAPTVLVRQMEGALESLEDAVDDRKGPEARQAAIAVAHSALDLELRHRSSADVDRSRIGIWEAQLRLDREAGDAAAVAGDEVTIEAIRARIR